VMACAKASSGVLIGGNARQGEVGAGAAGHQWRWRSGGVAWRRFAASRTGVRARRCQGAGRVALAGSLGSTWPRMCRGRGPPAAYGRAAAEQRGERE